MAKVSPWHSIKQTIHHNNTNCNTGNNIERENRREESATAEGGFMRPFFPVALAVAVAIVFATPLGAAAVSPAVSDISGTALGQSMITAAKDRFAAHGYTGGELLAWRDGAGYLIAPKGAILDRLEGVLRPVTAAAPTSQSPRTGNRIDGASAAATAAGYTLVANDCFARIYATYAYLDHCYQVHKLTSDGSGTYDYYALQRYATFGPTNPPFNNFYYVKRATIEAEAFTTQTWVDWIPKSDTNSNCNSMNISIAILGVSISLPTTKCEIWDQTKWNPAVKYNLKWIGKVNNVDRQLDFELGVRVAQGAWPQWFVPATVYSDPYP